jgi:hypothetical protein
LRAALLRSAQWTLNTSRKNSRKRGSEKIMRRATPSGVGQEDSLRHEA